MEGATEENMTDFFEQKTLRALTTQVQLQPTPRPQPNEQIQLKWN